MPNAAAGASVPDPAAGANLPTADPAAIRLPPAAPAGPADGLWQHTCCEAFIAGKDWIADLAEDPATASTTSVCLKFTDPRIKDAAAFAKAVAKRLEKEGVALDAGAYRDAPAGLRIWCGATVEASDVAALMPWIEYAFEAEIAAQSA